LKTEPTQCSETSAFNTQTPGKYPEDNLSLQQHGESLKTSTIKMFIIHELERFWTHLIYSQNQREMNLSLLAIQDLKPKT
jgi:hypothetical protein